MLRLGVDVRDLYLAKTGMRTFHEQIVLSLRKNEEVDLVVLAPKKQVKPPVDRIEKALEHIRFVLWKVVFLPIAAKNHRCEALLCGDYVAPFLTYGVKTFPVFHGANIWEQPENYNQMWKLYFSLLAKAGARKASLIFTVSEYSKRRLSSVVKLSPNKIVVVPNGPKPIDKTGEPEILENYGIDQCQYMLYVGVMEKRKNLPALIEAFAAVKRNGYKLVIVGQRINKEALDDYPQIMQMVDKKSLQKDMIFTDYVTDAQLAELYKNASFLVFPSKYEGFGMTILEAFQYHLPICISNIQVFEEVAGEAALYFDPNDTSDMASKICQMINDPKLRKDLVEKGSLQLSHYSWEKSAKLLVDQIKSFC